MIVDETFSIESDKKTISPEQTQYKIVQEKTVGGDKVFTIAAVDDDSGRSLAEKTKNQRFNDNQIRNDRDESYHCVGKVPPQT
jgi:hypothetical protein